MVVRWAWELLLGF